MFKLKDIIIHRRRTLSFTSSKNTYFRAKPSNQPEDLDGSYINQLIGFMD